MSHWAPATWIEEIEPAIARRWSDLKCVCFRSLQPRVVFVEIDLIVALELKPNNGLCHQANIFIVPTCWPSHEPFLDPIKSSKSRPTSWGVSRGWWRSSNWGTYATSKVGWNDIQFSVLQFRKRSGIHIFPLKHLKNFTIWKGWITVTPIVKKKRIKKNSDIKLIHALKKFHPSMLSKAR